MSEIEKKIQEKYSKKSKGKGGLFLLKPSDSIEYIEECVRSNLILLGVEGFFVGEGDSVQPRQEHSNDIYYFSGGISEFVQETILFIEDRKNIPNLWFDVVVKIV